MTIPGIWTEGDEGWRLSRPDGFPDEATLHRLIEQNPDMLPLAGSPRLVILGSEVWLPSGYPDLLGVEASGRPVVIEVKGSWSPDASWPIVAQILAYASSLHGMTREELEDRLRGNLQKVGHATILDAVKASDPERGFDDEEFTAALDDHLREGRFRLVLVLDDVSDSLTRVVAYLEHVTDKVIIDLVAVGAFDVDGARIIIPQRVALERREAVEKQADPSEPGAQYHSGSEKFEASIGNASKEHQDELRRLLNWARGLEDRGWARLATSEGKGARRFVLNPILRAEDVVLVSIWNESGVSLSFYRSVFARKAPDFIERVEALVGFPLGQGTSTWDITDDLLEVLTEAYEHAAK